MFKDLIHRGMIYNYAIVKDKIYFYTSKKYYKEEEHYDGRAGMIVRRKVLDKIVPNKLKIYKIDDSFDEKQFIESPGFYLISNGITN